MLPYKVFALAFLLVFVSLQVILIRTDFSATRTIEIKMRRYKDSTTYLKGIQPEHAPIDQFVVKVKPAGITDSLLLTNSKGNLLGIFFKIAAIILFTWFVFNLSYSNFLSVKSFNITWFTAALIGCVLAAHSYGICYTRDFWNKLYAAKGGVGNGRFSMYVDTSHNFHYYVIPVIFALGLYRYFISQHIKVINNMAVVE